MGEGKKEIELAMVDEADSYEVDEAHIIFLPDTGRFLLKTASGCSCWDGEYDIEEYASLDEIEAAMGTDDRRYNPTLEGAKQLMTEARAAFVAMAH